MKNNCCLLPRANIFLFAKIDVMPTVTQVVNSPGLIGLNWVPPESMKNTSYKYALKYRVLPELNQKVLRLGPSIHQFVIPTGGDIGRQYELELSIITKEEEGRPIKYTVRSGMLLTNLYHNIFSYMLSKSDQFGLDLQTSIATN